MRRPKSYFSHFVILLAALLLGAAALLMFGADKQTQIVLIWSLPAIYIAWGIAHHWKIGDLHPKIAAEYILIALLGGVILFSAVR